MIYLKLFLGDLEIKSWIESENIKESSILMILKKRKKKKNQEEVIKKTNLDYSFLRIKLCWRTDQEYSEILYVLNGFIDYFAAQGRSDYYRGRTLLDYVEENGILAYISYWKLLKLEYRGLKPLMFWTIEKTIERWIKEKF